MCDQYFMSNEVPFVLVPSKLSEFFGDLKIKVELKFHLFG